MEACTSSLVFVSILIFFDNFVSSLPMLGLIGVVKRQVRNTLSGWLSVFHGTTKSLYEFLILRIYLGVHGGNLYGWNAC